IAKSQTRSGEDVNFGNDPTIMPGPENTYQSYGTAWANLSNSPFRLYKHWVHEGGIATPLIVHWPQGLTDKGTLRHTPGQLTDIMATIVDITGASYPNLFNGNDILPMEGRSLKPLFEADEDSETPLYWEHEGNAAVRIGKWKLVKEYPHDWELFDMQKDSTETHNLADHYPEFVQEMADRYERWANRCGVVPREKILQIMEES